MAYRKFPFLPRWKIPSAGPKITVVYFHAYSNHIVDYQLWTIRSPTSLALDFSVMRTTKHLY